MRRELNVFCMEHRLLYQAWGITVEPTFDWLPSVQIVAENEDHSTTKTEIDFRVVERTDIPNIILDVNEGVVYVPYG